MAFFKPAVCVELRLSLTTYTQPSLPPTDEGIGVAYPISKPQPSRSRLC